MGSTKMKINKDVASLTLMKNIVDDDFVDATIADRISMVWDITEELWSLTKEGETSVKSRLQRNVANLKRPQR